MSRRVPRALVVALVVLLIGTASGIWLLRPWSDEQAGDVEALGVYGRVPDFALTERSGRTVRLADLRGTVWLANFIYTACTETCPTQSRQVARLQQEFAAEPDLRLVSISVDSAHDTPDVLARYAERYGADAGRWLFLTGPKPVIYALAKDGFKLGVVDPRGQAGGVLEWLAPRAAWALRPGPRSYLLIALVGFALAVAVEWNALHRTGAWAYTPGMPLVPGLGVGLLPVLQMLVLPPLTFLVVGRWRRWWEARP